MRSSFRTAIILTVVALQLAFASVAFAAPVQWQGVDIVSHPEASAGVVTVIGTLPEATPLPAQAQLSVPAGAQIQWIGEILGGDPANDIQLTPTKTTVGGADVYSFTLTKARTAQVEIITPGPAFDGTSYTSSVNWIATQDIPEVRLALRLPAGAQIASPTPDASTIPGEAGFEYYVRTLNNVKAGDALALTAVYTVPAAPAAAPTGSNSGQTATVIIVVLLVLAGAALVFSLRRKVGGGSADDDEYEDDTDSDADTTADAAPSKRPAVASASKESPDAEESESAPPRSNVARRNMVTAVIVVIMIIIAVVLGMQAGKPQVIGDSITETYSAQEPCATISVALATAGDDDPAGTGKTLFDAIRPLAGLTTATYNFKTSSLDIGFCESETSEEAIRAAIAPTGLLAE